MSSLGHHREYPREFGSRKRLNRNYDQSRSNHWNASSPGICHEGEYNRKPLRLFEPEPHADMQEREFYSKIERIPIVKKHDHRKIEALYQSLNPACKGSCKFCQGWLDEAISRLSQDFRYKYWEYLSKNNLPKSISSFKNWLSFKVNIVKSLQSGRKEKHIQTSIRESSVSKPSLCFCCKKQAEHKLQVCPQFINWSSLQRIQFLSKHDRCQLCLESHNGKKCFTKLACEICSSRRHHSLLHIFKPDPEIRPEPNLQVIPEPDPEVDTRSDPEQQESESESPVEKEENCLNKETILEKENECLPPEPILVYSPESSPETPSQVQEETPLEEEVLPEIQPQVEEEPLETETVAEVSNTEEQTEKGLEIETVNETVQVSKTKKLCKKPSKSKPRAKFWQSRLFLHVARTSVMKTFRSHAHLSSIIRKRVTLPHVRNRRCKGYRDEP